ncbi:low affinity immunoglobulin gamma Fc region receptor II-like [Sylvia borin]
MAGDTGMAGKVALLLWGWCPLSPAGAQTTKLLVEPPWTPAVLWDQVTLTCQGWGTANATTWYKDGQQWEKEVRDKFVVTKSGTYTCERPGTGLSPPVRVLNDWLVLQMPARPLLEGHTVTLRCRSWENRSLTHVHFYHEEKDLGEAHDGTELSLSPLQLHHSGRYRCRGWLRAEVPQWRNSELVTVTVHMAAGVGGSLLFLVLLVAVIVIWHQWHQLASRKQQESASLHHCFQEAARSCNDLVLHCFPSLVLHHFPNGEDSSRTQLHLLPPSVPHGLPPHPQPGAPPYPRQSGGCLHPPAASAMLPVLPAAMSLLPQPIAALARSTCPQQPPTAITCQCQRHAGAAAWKSFPATHKSHEGSPHTHYIC